MDEKKIEDIAQLLPEGITEETIVEIAGVMESLIEQRVQEEVSDLTDKVFAYLSMKRQQIQEAALEELHESNAVYRDAQRFRELMGYMAVEYRPEYIDAESEKRLSEASELSEDNEILARELSDSLREQERLAKTIQLLESKVSKREREIDSLNESVTTLAEEKEAMLFESTEQAVVITENVDEKVEDQNLESIGNEFLTEEMLKLMK
jgi:flagellar motility protein MotE (MotC chaperone)